MRTTSWLLIGIGALALVGGLALLVVMLGAELPEQIDRSTLVAILVVNVVLGLSQIASGARLRTRSVLAHRVALGATGLQLILAIVDVGLALFAEGSGSAALPGVRVALNAIAIRQLFGLRPWFARADSVPAGGPTIVA